MYIEELTESESGIGEEESSADVRITEVAFLNAKKALIVVGGRILFYPTLLYNVLRNKIESEFRWWDLIDEFLLLGAVPFPTDVPRLKQLGVEGVITLNEPYETLVPTSLYLVRDEEDKSGRFGQREVSEKTRKDRIKNGQEQGFKGAKRDKEASPPYYNY
ncbi:Phosphatidylglycerophosphatase and protein-tyrosine phosphatase 1 [Asimina triloba]